MLQKPRTRFARENSLRSTRHETHKGFDPLEDGARLSVSDERRRRRGSEKPRTACRISAKIGGTSVNIFPRDDLLHEHIGGAEISTFHKSILDSSPTGPNAVGFCQTTRGIGCRQSGSTARAAIAVHVFQRETPSF